MAYSNVLTLDQIIQALYEDKGIFNLCNRNYDSFVIEHGASKCSIPAIPLLEAVTPPATNRKAVLGDTNMVEVVMQKSVVELAEEVEAKYQNRSGSLMMGFIEGSAKAHRKNFDAKVIAEAQTYGTGIQWKGAQVSWEDFMAIDAKFDALEVDPDDRFIVYPARIKEQVLAIDVIKTAMSMNPEYLERGIVRVANMQIISSARVDKIGGKENLVGVWGMGLAFILDAMMDRKEAYNTTSKATDIDYIADYGTKLLKADYAVINKQQ